MIFEKAAYSSRMDVVLFTYLDPQGKQKKIMNRKDHVLQCQKSNYVLLMIWKYEYAYLKWIRIHSIFHTYAEPRKLLRNFYQLFANNLSNLLRPAVFRKYTPPMKAIVKTFTAVIIVCHILPVHQFVLYYCFLQTTVMFLNKICG